MKHSSYRRRLLVDFLLVGILPLLVCVSLIFVVFRSAILSSAETSARSQLSALTEGLAGLVETCDRVLARIGEEPLVVNALGESAGRDTKVYSALYTSVMPLERGADVSLYDAEGHMLYTTGVGRTGEDLDPNWGVLALARERGELVCRRVSPYDKVARGCMQLARRVTDGTDTVGYAVAELSEEQVGALFAGLYDGGSEIVLLDGFWDEVYASPGLRDSGLATWLRSRLLSGGSLSDGRGEAEYYVEREELSGFTVALRQPRPLADWVMRLFYIIVGVSILVSLLLCLRVAVGFSRRIFEPVSSLNRAMAQVEEGDLAVRLSVPGTDEMSQLSGRFNRMAERLKENLDQSVRQQQELGDAQIRMMQAQLNPHFLYNTLDTLKWLGKINKVEEVSTISADLADILRRSISAREFVPLREELALLERYVEIQKIRFPGKFEYVTDVDPGALEVPVPKLMLQPLVENAVIHGFEDGSHGVVRVSARRQGGELTVTVEDDGVGMDPDSLARFQARQGPREGGGHFGLYNVDAILRLHYGQDRGLKLVPVEKGTCIRAVLPVKEGDET